MLSQHSLIGFIPTTDGARARHFYVDVLQLEFLHDDSFALVVKTGQNSIRIVRLKSLTPAPYTILGWEVPDIQRTAQDLAASGVSFQRFPYLEQDALGIWTAPDGSKVAWFHDPDGNTLSISQH